ncbi:hypothetical protein [Alienimonas californiensis]|uniref:Uncharacterized protein n=1 Tax=Alienimonas californiensis TaxID=2527989 RepID=A0A517PED8_9PLAN|nr:hypothetical protein [Alienimonas californiensis]QDT17711.1 hypothetical protein CA12_38420 [Alienimonas californiensis]
MPPQQARRNSRPAPGGSTTGANSTGASPAEPLRTGPPRILCAAEVRLGGIPAGLPPLSGEAAEIAAGASRRQWDALVNAAAEADAFVLIGRLLDPAADLRAERALRDGLERLAAAEVATFALTDEPLPDDLPLTLLAPDEPSEIELSRGGEGLAVLRTLAGAATFPMPDGLPVLGITSEPEADAEGCDALFTLSSAASEAAPGTWFVLPETAGAAGGRTEPRGERAVRFFAPVLELPEEPHDLPARLRNAAPRRDDGERLRIVDWTLHVGPWGDRLTDEDARALAGALSDTWALHSVTVLPHPGRFVDGDEDEPGEAAAFLEALAHFDPLGDAPALPGVAPDPDRVRTLATRFAAPLLSAG